VDPEAEQERRHFLAIVRSYTEYVAHGVSEVARRKRHLLALPAAHVARLPGGEAGVRKQLAAMLAAVHTNATFCHQLGVDDNGYHRAYGTTVAERSGTVSPAQSIQSEEQLPTTRPTWSSSATAANLTKVVTALWQLAREWSKEGAAERAQCLEPMFAELNRLRPVTSANRNEQRVLAPGCGAGRIVLELAVRGIYPKRKTKFEFKTSTAFAQAG